MFLIFKINIKRFIANAVYQIANFRTIRQAKGGDTAAMFAVASDHIFFNPHLNPFDGIDMMEAAAMLGNTAAIKTMLLLHETEIFFPKCEIEIEEWKMMQDVITRPYDCTEVDHDLPRMANA